jgi:hypothetical protein
MLQQLYYVTLHKINNFKSKTGIKPNASIHNSRVIPIHLGGVILNQITQTQQISQLVNQLMRQTEQASLQYQHLLQQEEMNARQLEQIAQREQQAAQIIQTALQGHQTAMQQLQQINSMCSQLSSAASFTPNYMNNQNIAGQFSNFTQH